MENLTIKAVLRFFIMCVILTTILYLAGLVVPSIQENWSFIKGLIVGLSTGVFITSWSTGFPQLSTSNVD